MSEKYVTEFRVDRFSENGQFSEIKEEFYSAVEQYEEYEQIQSGSFEFNVHQAHEFDCNARASITFLNSDECKKQKENGFYPGMCETDVEDECVLDLAGGNLAGKARDCGEFVRSGTTHTG